MNIGYTEAFIVNTGTGKQLDIEKLKIEANIKVNYPTKDINASYANICLYLYNYLVEETHIKPNPNTVFSDSMLNFYFDTLELFEYLNQDDIQSEKKDYMGTLLKNHIKGIKRYKSGK